MPQAFAVVLRMNGLKHYKCEDAALQEVRGQRAIEIHNTASPQRAAHFEAYSTCRGFKISISSTSSNNVRRSRRAHRDSGPQQSLDASAHFFPSSMAALQSFLQIPHFSIYNSLFPVTDAHRTCTGDHYYLKQVVIK